MIEIRTIDAPSGLKEYRLFVDDLLIENAHVFNRYGKPTTEARTLGIVACDEQTSEVLTKWTISEYPEVMHVQLEPRSGFSPLVRHVYVETTWQPPRDRATIGFHLAPNADWENELSFREYHRAFELLAKTQTDLGATVTPIHEDDDATDFIVRFPFSSLMSQVRLEISRSYDLLLEFHEEVRRSLSWNPLESRSLVSWFDFPDEIRVPCEQYLQYFVQFLRDLGIDADSELKQQAGRVLFSVRPKDQIEALDNIREALEIYVLLPTSPISDESWLFGDNIEYGRLAANVLHLRSQLQLARAISQAQNATIRAQQLTIGEQQSGNNVIEQSLVNIDYVAKDKEDLLGGRLSLGRYETKGVSLNWAMLFRDLKRIFKNNRGGGNQAKPNLVKKT